MERALTRMAHEIVEHNPEAESLALDQAVYLPIYHYSTTELVKPWVRGIYQTALAALASRYQVTVLIDAVAARRDDDAQAALAALARAGVNVLPAETVFYTMLHDATHPFFKAYTQLVKKYA